MFDRYFHLFIIMTGICQKTLCYCDSYECTEWTSNIMELFQIWNIILDQNFWFQWMYNNLLFQGQQQLIVTQIKASIYSTLLYLQINRKYPRIEELPIIWILCQWMSYERLLWTLNFNVPWLTVHGMSVPVTVSTLDTLQQMWKQS